MQTFIFLCFDTKAVLYVFQNGKVQECRFRGNDTLSLEWSANRFEEVWAYFEDVYDIGSWEETEIVMYCQDKKGYSLWEKMQYPISRNAGGITVQEYNRIVPELAKAQGLLNKGKAVLSWRDYVWEVQNNQCTLIQGQSAKSLSDGDFVSLIAKYIAVKNGESQNIVVSLEAETRQMEKLKEELDEVKNFNERQTEELFFLQKEYQKLLDDKKLLSCSYNELLDNTQEYLDFSKSSKFCLLNPAISTSTLQEEMDWYNKAEYNIKTLNEIFADFDLKYLFKDVDCRKFKSFYEICFSDSQREDRLYLYKRIPENFEKLLGKYLLSTICDLFVDIKESKNAYLQELTTIIKGYQEPLENFINWFYQIKLKYIFALKIYNLPSCEEKTIISAFCDDSLGDVRKLSKYDIYFLKKKEFNFINEYIDNSQKQLTKIAPLAELVNYSDVDYSIAKIKEALEPSLQSIKSGLAKAEKLLFSHNADNALFVAAVLAQQDFAV